MKEAGAASGEVEIRSSYAKHDSLRLLQSRKLVSGIQRDLSHGNQEEATDEEARSGTYKKHESIRALKGRALVSRRPSEDEDLDNRKGDAAEGGSDAYVKHPSVQKLSKASLVAQSSWREPQLSHLPEIGPNAVSSPSELPEVGGCQGQQALQQEVVGAVPGQIPNEQEVVGAMAGQIDDVAACRETGAASEAAPALPNSGTPGSEPSCWSCFSWFFESAPRLPSGGRKR